MQNKRFVDWAFNHYLNVAHPDFATAGVAAGGAARAALAGVGAGAT
jgi:hypothetical protein